MGKLIFNLQKNRIFGEFVEINLNYRSIPALSRAFIFRHLYLLPRRSKLSKVSTKQLQGHALLALYLHTFYNEYIIQKIGSFEQKCDRTNEKRESGEVTGSYSWLWWGEARSGSKWRLEGIIAPIVPPPQRTSLRAEIILELRK